MKLNKIQKLKSGRYKLFFDDDSIITYDNVILKNNLLTNKEIDNNLYNKILEDTKYFNAYDNVVKYTLKKMRSEKEILIYLEKFNITHKEKISIVKKLKDINLINDLEYCKAFISDKVRLSNFGVEKIKIQLLAKNISLNIIENELEQIEEEIINNKLEKLIKKRIRSNRKYSNSYLKNKILNEMINLGYNKDKILDIIENNLISDYNILNTEFSKLYTQKSKKYNGYELKKKVEQILINRGFNVYDIKELLQKTEE